VFPPNPIVWKGGGGGGTGKVSASPFWSKGRKEKNWKGEPRCSARISSRKGAVPKKEEKESSSGPFELTTEARGGKGKRISKKRKKKCTAVPAPFRPGGKRKKGRGNLRARQLATIRSCPARESEGKNPLLRRPFWEKKKGEKKISGKGGGTRTGRRLVTEIYGEENRKKKPVGCSSSGKRK